VTRLENNSPLHFQQFFDILKLNKGAVDNYFHKNNRPTFKYKKLNPMKNYYKLSVDESDTEMTNPFKDVEDSVAFAKKLRECR